MSGIRKIFVFSLAISAAAALTMNARDTAAADPVKNAAGADKAPVKKKIIKKKKKAAPKPVSEYKFDRIDHVPAYTFDKQTNPIIKGAKRKKKAPARGGKYPAKKTSATAPREKLKPLPPIEDDGRRQPDTEGGTANG